MDISTCENKIDYIVYVLYGLIPEKITVVEAATA